MQDTRLRVTELDERVGADAGNQWVSDRSSQGFGDVGVASNIGAGSIFTTRSRLLRGLAWLCLVVVTPALALDPQKPFRQYASQNWSVDRGLPQVTASAVTQDVDGYIWVGTQQGVARFDGARFVAYGPATHPGFPGEMVNAVLADRLSGVWVGTYKGLAHVHDDTVDVFPTLDAQPVKISGLSQLADGTLIAGSDRGVLSLRDGKLVPTLAMNRPVHALATLDDSVWLGADDAVLVLDGVASLAAIDANATPAAWREEPLPRRRSGEVVRINALAFDGPRVWAATNAGLYRREDGRWRPVNASAELVGDPVGSLLLDRDGNLWAGGLRGLSRFHNGEFVEFVRAGDANTQPDYRAAYEDREGNLWFGSRGGGVQLFWSGWTARYSAAEGLGEPIVWSLAEAGPDRLWVGTESGLWSLERGRFRQVVSGSQLPHPNVYTLYADGDTLWIGTRSGLAIYDRWRGLQAAPARLHELSASQINGILRDRQQRLWVATDDGLLGDSATGSLERFTPPGAAVRYLLEARDGRLWVGTTHGMWRREGRQFIKVSDFEPTLPPDIDVLAIAERANGDIVATTISGQLLLRSEGSWTLLRQADGLLNNPGFFLNEDRNDTLWIAGMRGISRLSVSALYARVQGRSSLLKSEFVLNEAGARSGGEKGSCCNGAGNAKGVVQGNRLWLPSRDGVVSVETTTVTANPVPPALKIERYQTGADWLRVEPRRLTPLPLGQRDLSIEFTALSFRDPVSVRLRYRLAGYDRGWSDLEDPLHRSVRYTNLPPGRYQFELSAANESGIWSTEAVRFDFEVPPQFYETLQFKLAIAAVMLVAVLMCIRWVLISSVRQRRKLEEQVEQRTVALAELNKQLRRTSLIDPLTRVANRRAMQEFMNRLVNPAALRDSASTSSATHGAMLLVLVDVDHFKTINDGYGHAAGDQVLIEFARVLGADCQRERGRPVPAQLARWGGEEFLLVYHPLDRAQVLDIASSLCRQVAEHVFVIDDHSRVGITASIGFAEVPARSNGETLAWEHWLELADQALYDAKNAGRNRWAGYRMTRDTDVRVVQRCPRGELMGLVKRGQLLYVRA